jgi:hypothetical protein
MPMDTPEPPTVEQYRQAAKEIRQMAERTLSPEIKQDLLDLAERYGRLAARANRREAVPQTPPEGLARAAAKISGETSSPAGD